MSNFLKSLIWFLVFAFVAALIHFYFIKDYCGVCANSDTSEKSKSFSETQFAEFSISDTDGKAIFKFPKGFIINSLDGKVIIPEGLGNLKDSLFNFMNQHQDKELIISGKYLSSEGEIRGLDRANFLKDFLVKFGVNADKILPKAVLSDYSYDNDNQYNQGIGMVFQNVSTENQAIIDEHIADKLLYAEYGEANFQPDNTLIAYANELKNYLQNHSDKKVVITGHTDDKGSDATNSRLGLMRAKKVGEYLVSQGIAKNIISTQSKGETEPIADNTTDEGRAKNRRIHINVK